MSRVVVDCEFMCGFIILFVVISVGCFQVDSNTSRTGDTAVSTSASSVLPIDTRQNISSEFTRPRSRLLTSRSSCFVPRQPAHGVRRRHRYYCGDKREDCDVKEGAILAPGTLLNYTCHPGYKIIGNPLVLCEGKAKWSKIPKCVVIKCRPLNSTSLTARCFRHGRWKDCNFPVLQGTRAKLSCPPGYLEARSSDTVRSETVQCNVDEKWEPDPIECRPACGVAISDTATDFPWRASLYQKYPEYEETHFKCGATIIRNNLVLTAANCVYNDETNLTLASKKLFVMTGNNFQDYDHPLHDPKTVRKSGVKNVHVHCRYHGRDSAGDIALVEIEDPFEFSSFHLPACLEDSRVVEKASDPNAYGSVAEFGATFTSIKNVPYLPYDKCNSSAKLVVDYQFTSDKFCTGYQNRSSTVCISDKGGGLVFKKHDLWYVIGVVTSVPFRTFYNGEYGCENYAQHTNVTRYTAWIQDVIFDLERYKLHPPCHSKGLPNNPMLRPTDPNTGRINLHDENPSCPSPPQPENGRWRFHKSLCANETVCKMLKGAPLRPGTQLIYSCHRSYRAKGSTQVYCGIDGKWSAIPVCAQIKCESLNSVSTAASCYNRFDERVSCDFGILPGTRADVSCHLGYRMYTAFSTFQRKTVRCGRDGRWSPDPIRCAPVCGEARTHQTPFIVNGTAAKLSDFPWHATLYLQKGTSRKSPKEFICGATIIQNNFVLTAAHCVYDETIEKTRDPSRLFVVTGNIIQNYDYRYHNPISVRKTQVKNIFRHCNYRGVTGNYASDIALLEIEPPFVFSNILSPVCLDVKDYGAQILEPGAEGRVAGFGIMATGETSGILQTLTLPYIPYNQCVSKIKEKDDMPFTRDKFCAGYTNGSTVCEGDSGGGLVFRKHGLWYVLGIVSLGLNVDVDNGERTCDKYGYSLYTKVSEHMNWIQDVMYQRARHHVYPPCDNDILRND